MAPRWRLEGDGPIDVTRDTHGVPHVRATTEADLYRGLGHCHGTDRALPLLLARILAEGRGSEVLDASDEMLVLDRFFRRANLGAGAGHEALKLTAAERGLVEAYCDGVNRALATRVPWELRIRGYTPAPWSFQDVVLLSRATGYVGLAQTQADVERLFLEMVQGGVPRAHLDELFPGLVGDADLALLGKVTLGARLVPEAIRWQSALPRMIASNNWAVGPQKTARGHAIAAYDPHLEVNRLPPVWYEVVLELGERWCVAATVPGVSAALFGRTNDLAWGATYTFMDQVDSWVEDCREGRFRRMERGHETWIPFRTRTEIIRRRRKPDVTVTLHENDHGVLDGDPHRPGLYLTTQWAGGIDTGAVLLHAMHGMLHAPDVATGMELLGTVEIACNFVLADRHGDIGYQMSGRMPVRRPGVTGFVPLPGWDPANDWQGFVAPTDLPRVVNPEAGFVATANEDLNHLGRVRPINIAMGPYRAERIAELLAARDDWTVEEMRRMQMDVHSSHAVRFMEVLRPLLPAIPEGAILETWDCDYDLESRGAPLFERFYRALVREVFGNGCGSGVIDFLWCETGILTDFYYNFDVVLLRAESVWYGADGRDVTWRRIAERVLPGPTRPWGRERELLMKHLMLGGRLPRWLGFDHGPIQLRGNRATIHQGQIYRSGGRDTSFAPSFRLISDLGTDTAHTVLAGGPSDRRFSPWYRTGIDDWLAGRLKAQGPTRR